MPLSVRVVTATGFMSLYTAFSACADEGDCDAYQWSSRSSDARLGRINASAPHTFFVLNGHEAVGCPSEDARCHDVSYLVPGDQVVLGSTNGGFVCASFVDAKAYLHVGWLPSRALAPEPAPTVNLSDWIGHWVAMESDVTIKPAAKPGALSISGDATWGGFDPERVKNGAVNTGEIAGLASPSGPTLALDETTNSDCKVWMRRLGPYLLVSDTSNCGGMNVSFLGVYTRGSSPFWWRTHK